MIAGGASFAPRRWSFPAEAIPEALRQTFAKEIVQDQISAANPYAPLAIPVLADATGVPHASPVMVFVPDDPALGQYQKDFANTLCLFEEREPVPPKTKTYSTDKAIEAVLDDVDVRVARTEERNAVVTRGIVDGHDDIALTYARYFAAANAGLLLDFRHDVSNFHSIAHFQISELIKRNLRRLACYLDDFALDILPLDFHGGKYNTED
jgi:hypothetical protein